MSELNKTPPEHLEWIKVQAKDWFEHDETHYLFDTGFIKGRIQPQWMTPGFMYSLRFSTKDMDNKPIVIHPEGIKRRILTIKQAKAEILVLVRLIYEAAFKPGQVWKMKGVMLGLLEEKQMEHLKEKV